MVYMYKGHHHLFTSVQLVNISPAATVINYLTTGIYTNFKIAVATWATTDSNLVAQPNFLGAQHQLIEFKLQMHVSQL